MPPLGGTLDLSPLIVIVLAQLVLMLLVAVARERRDAAVHLTELRVAALSLVTKAANYAAAAAFVTDSSAPISFSTSSNAKIASGPVGDRSVNGDS